MDTEIRRRRRLRVILCFSRLRGLAIVDGNAGLVSSELPNLDGARLHRLRNPSNQIDVQQTIVSRSVLYFDIVSEIEFPLKATSGDSSEQILPLLWRRPETVSKFCSDVIDKSSRPKPATAIEIRKVSGPVLRIL